MSVVTGPSLSPVSSPSIKARSVLSEWPTFLVLGGHYAGFAALTFFWTSVPVWLAIPLAAYLICLNAHLTHELIHGHPFRNKHANRWLLPINLLAWIPYEVFRDTHIAHHNTEHLTDPVRDPESFYWTAEQWDAMSPIWRVIHRFNYTFIGRMTVGPMLIVGRFWRDEAQRILRGDLQYLLPWGILLAGNAVLAYWLFAICQVPIWQAAIAFYSGSSLMALRSFVEHRPAADHDSSCAIVEAGPVFQLLFLNNCFHLIHHDRPGLAWYEIPGVYRANREEWRRRSGHVFRGYWDVILRTAIRPKDDPQHPGTA